MTVWIHKETRLYGLNVAFDLSNLGDCEEHSVVLSYLTNKCDSITGKALRPNVTVLL